MTQKEIDKKRKEMGAELKRQRLIKDYSLREAAALCGSDHQRIMDVERGKNFTFDTVCRIASLYGLEITITKQP